MQHFLQDAPAPHAVPLGKHGSLPQALVALLYQYVAGLAHLSHVAPTVQRVPSAHRTVTAGLGVGSTPHATASLLLQKVAGFWQLLHVVPCLHTVPSAHLAAPPHLVPDASFALWQHLWHVFCGSHAVPLLQHGSGPHAVPFVPTHRVAGLAHERHVLLRAQGVPSGHLGPPHLVATLLLLLLLLLLAVVGMGCWQHLAHVLPARQTAPSFQHGSVPHAVTSLLSHQVAGLAHWLQVVPTPQAVPSANAGSNNRPTSVTFAAASEEFVVVAAAAAAPRRPRLSSGSAAAAPRAPVAMTTTNP
jgi:hypothetical protein